MSSSFDFEVQFNFYKKTHGTADELRGRGVCMALKNIEMAETKIAELTKRYADNLADITRAMENMTNPWGTINRPEEMAEALMQRKMGFEMLGCLLTADEKKELGLAQ
jgi:hypothetical protein